MPDDDRIVEALIRAYGPGPGVPSGPCPDPGQIAGLVEGLLTPQERDKVEAHLPSCRSCLGPVTRLGGILRGLGGARVVPFRSAQPAWRRIMVPVAAAVLIAIGVAIWGPRWWTTPQLDPGPTADDTDRLLVAAAGDLARAHPEFFAAFAPLGPAERRAAGRDVVRSDALPALSPRRKILDARPAFRWEQSPGVSEYEIVLHAPQGEVFRLRHRASAPVDGVIEASFPEGSADLRPGVTYLWSATPFGSGAGFSGTAFTVASPEDASSLATAREMIAAGAPSSVAMLLDAHFSLRCGFLGDAEKLARRFLGDHPGNPVARDTIYRLLSDAGAKEAARFQPPPVRPR